MNICNWDPGICAIGAPGICAMGALEYAHISINMRLGPWNILKEATFKGFLLLTEDHFHSTYVYIFYNLHHDTALFM